MDEKNPIRDKLREAEIIQEIMATIKSNLLINVKRCRNWMDSMEKQESLDLFEEKILEEFSRMKIEMLDLIVRSSQLEEEVFRKLISSYVIPEISWREKQ